MDNDSTTTPSILRGWKNFLGKISSGTAEKRPFPENRFFPAEELAFLSKQKDTTLLEKWAVQLGKEAAEKSSSGKEFNPVQWSDGLLGSWIDDEPYYIDSQTQASYLRMLGDNGYQLTPKHESFIRQQEKAGLLGKVLEDGDSFLVVEDNPYGKVEAPDSFTLHSYAKNDMAEAEIPYDLDMFHDAMRKGELRFASEAATEEFVSRHKALQEAKDLFKATHSEISGTPSLQSGTFPMEKRFSDHSTIGNYELSSWVSDNNHTIDVTGKFGSSSKPETILISEENAYKYRDLVQAVKDSLAIVRAQQEKGLDGKLQGATNITPNDPKLTENVSISGENKKEQFRDLLSQLDASLSDMRNEENSYDSRLKSYESAETLGKAIYDSMEKDRDLREIFYSYQYSHDDNGIFVNGVGNKDLVEDMYHSLHEGKELTYEDIPRGLVKYDPMFYGIQESFEPDSKDARKAIKDRSESYFDYAINPIKQTKLQGLEGYSIQDIKDRVEESFNEPFEYELDGPVIKGMEIYGSRGRGTATEGSDLDVVVEYEGDAREDDVFNAVHEHPLEIGGIKVDINPINEGKTGTLIEYMEKVRKYDRQVLNGEKPRFSLAPSNDGKNLDREYMEAVENGDMEKAQRMVNEAAMRNGYDLESSYQGTSAFNGSAPWGNGYYMSPEERKQAWEKGEMDGDQTLADYINNGVDAMNLNFVALDSRNYRAVNDARKEAILNVRNTIQFKRDYIMMYRSVPADVKEGSFRNGDWVSPSRSYAVENAKIHGWGDNYRIIEQKVPIDEIWWDGNDIAEWGYGREQDYVNDKDFAYKNTQNNKKSLDAVVYDDNGKVIPLSKRFNENVSDVRYQTATTEKPLTMEEVELRDTLIDKLRSSGIDVITDTKEGQRVLDLYKDKARHMVAYHGSGADFEKFDLEHLGEGAGSQAFGWGVYVTSSKDIAHGYATSMDDDRTRLYFRTRYSNGLRFLKEWPSLENFLSDDKVKSSDWSEQKKVDYYKDHAKDAEPYHNIYEVNIPEDNGKNFLEWYKPLSDEQKDTISKQLKRLKVDMGDYERRGFSMDDSFGDVYKFLTYALRHTKKWQDVNATRATSNFLSSLGFTGIKYPAGTIMGGAKEGDMNYVIFNPDDMKIKDHVRFFKSKEGESYGFTVGGKIYVDPKIATAETPIHEYTHLWATALQKGNPKEWANVVGLMKGTTVWNEVKENYKDLKTDDEIADEVLATYSGRRGAEKLRQMAAEVKDGDYSAAKKSNVARGIFQVQQALERFWKKVSSFLGLHYTSAEEVADRVMRDMLDGVNPSKQLREFNSQRDEEYMKAVKSGNLGKAYSMVMEEADMMLAENPMPEVTDAYALRQDSVPGKTIKVYKVFTLDKDGDPTAMYVSGKDKLPMGVWLDAQDTWHFTAKNGKQYVPSTKNPNGRGGRTGTCVPIPNDDVRQELIERGFLPKDSTASSIVALAYRPGWHAADLPYFPQGGKQDKESNYGHVHRHNQVVFECELSADNNYTEVARSQPKALKADGTLNAREADLQWLPQDGYYQYTTNQFLPDEEKGHWYIGGSLRINRALTQEECDKILAENGKPAQEWQQGHLDLARLGYVSSLSHVKPILSPVAYYENGEVIPLSERFKTFKEEIEPALERTNTDIVQHKDYNPREWSHAIKGEWTKNKIIRRLKDSGGSLLGKDAAARLICEFGSPKELKDHMFYHGTAHDGGNLKPSVILDKLSVNRNGSGNGQRYWGISLTPDKEAAAQYNGNHRSVDIVPVILAKGANVREMPELRDAAELDDHIEKLWKDGIDAVWIGGKSGDNKELCVLNPRAIVNLDDPDYYKTNGLGSKDNTVKTIDDAGIEKLYKDAHDYVKLLDKKPVPPKEPSRFVQKDGLMVTDEKGMYVYKDKQTYQREYAAYERAKDAFYSSGKYGEWRKSEDEQSKKIRFMFVGKKGAASMDEVENLGQSAKDSRISMLSLAKTMVEQEKDEKLIKHVTGWELGADDDWRYEIPDIKRFDWNGNIKFEQNHPEFVRYEELLHKENKNLWVDGEPLTGEERKEFDKLSKLFPSVPEKLDNNHTLDAYVDAPEFFKAYPELKDVKVSFESLDSNVVAKYSRSTSIFDYMDGNFSDMDKAIIINTNKLSMFTDKDTLKSVLSHEMQHAVQDIEGFAQGGSIDKVRKEVESIVHENQGAADYAKGKLKEWSGIKLLEINLDRYERLIKSDNPDLKQTAATYYSDALNYIDNSPKSEMKIDWDKFGDKTEVEMAETGLYVDEAKTELGRLAKLTDFEQKAIPEGNMESLQVVNKMERALEELSDEEMYWKLAGEVESRNVENRMNMSMEEKRNSLASETEDVARKEQFVIKSSPAASELNLVPKAGGRWHTEENKLTEAYGNYGKTLALYLSEYKDHGYIPWNDEIEVIDGNGKKFDGINALMLGLDYDNYHRSTNLPIYLTEDQIKENGYGKLPNAQPFPIIVDGKVKEAYHVSGVALKAGIVEPLNRNMELKTEYESWQRQNKPLVHSLDVFPVESYPELSISGKPTTDGDKNKLREYHHEVATKLVEYSRQGKVQSIDTMGERSKEVLVQSLAGAILGRKYGFMQAEGPEDRMRLAARLERDPKFAEDVLKESAKTAKGVETFIEDAVQSWGEEKKLDLRSLTPSEVDSDGNGIVDSQENLAPDSKQESDMTKEKPHEQQRHHGMGR